MFTFVQNTLSIPSSAHRVTSQAMALCTVCNGIPTYFFGPLHPAFLSWSNRLPANPLSWSDSLPPNSFSRSDRFFHYRHHTLSALRLSAAKGCPMCKILECQLKDYRVSPETKEKERLIMKRAINNPEQAFGLWMGHYEISHYYFYIVPTNYRGLSYFHVI